MVTLFHLAATRHQEHAQVEVEFARAEIKLDWKYVSNRVHQSLITCLYPRMFAVVEFPDGLGIISTKWFDGEEEDRAFWPPGDGRAVARLANQHAEPARTWATHDVRVMGKAGNYWHMRINLEGRRFNFVFFLL